MGNRGRHTKPRVSELGIYIENLRNKQGWSIHKLAEEAGISYKTLSKLELGQITPRKPGIIMKLARALDIHPDRLLLLAPLTPMLRPVSEEVFSNKNKEPLNILVTKEERRHLENYLRFLRYTESVEILSQRSENET